MQRNKPAYVLMVCVSVILFLEGMKSKLHKFKKDMMHRYGMTDLGMLHYFVGIEVSQKEYLFHSRSM